MVQERLVGVVVALLTAFGFVGTAPSTVTVSPAWQVTQLRASLSRPDSALSSVSCPTVRFCMAVGSTTKGPEVAVFDGSTWRTAVSPHRVSQRDQPLLEAVSCVSARFCTAVGERQLGRTNRFEAIAQRWNGHAWQRETLPTFHPTPTPAQLTGVSCPTTTTCMAVGLLAWPPGMTQTVEKAIAVLWHPSTGWEATKTDLSPTVSLLQQVSCVTAEHCVAVGGSTRKGNVVDTWNGARWIKKSFYQVGPSLEAVSCHSRADCVAVTGWEPPMSLVLDGSWSVHWSARLRSRNQSALDAVSCPTSDRCAAVGTINRTWGSSAPLIEEWNGSRWTRQTVARPGSPGSYLSGVSCPTTTDCVAVGSTQGRNGTNLIEQHV